MQQFCRTYFLHSNNELNFPPSRFKKCLTRKGRLGIKNCHLFFFFLITGIANAPNTYLCLSVCAVMCPFIWDWGPFLGAFWEPPSSQQKQPFFRCMGIGERRKKPNRALEATWIEMLVLHAEGTCHWAERLRGRQHTWRLRGNVGRQHLGEFVVLEAALQELFLRQASVVVLVHPEMTMTMMSVVAITWIQDYTVQQKCAYVPICAVRWIRYFLADILDRFQFERTFLNL